ncbi:hypothetical protein [Sphaerospermopsis torques-reginae]|uniref:Uncharacterized protein n=1 Tax=Sphaerospermopsis torques-reginae ITEP-024 TaxID=984208 RepID=A0ABX8WWI4_9CYAN|nr:hypothetical protein [Sphaerospermopsis torques-reginae]QYX30793.1 hypothetical protein K2F26_18255 [Sphaerospermopsis torques-reginae ITEP-024]
MRTIRNFTKVSTLTGVVLTSLLVSSHPVAAQRACVVTDSGSVVCGKLQQNSQKPSSVKNQTVELEDINVTLQGCKRSSSTVNCHFLLTAKQDGEVYLNCYSRSSSYNSKIFDTYGGEYFCNQTQLGQSKNEYRVSTKLLKNIPAKAIVTFKEIPTQVKEIAALELSVYLSNRLEYYSAVFRSIPISQ